MKPAAFWSFLGFGVVTVAVAFGGGVYTLTTQRGGMAAAFSFLLIFLGASLAAMLGSLLFIRSKEGKRP